MISMANDILTMDDSMESLATAISYNRTLTSMIEDNVTRTIRARANFYNMSVLDYSTGDMGRALLSLYLSERNPNIMGPAERYIYTYELNMLHYHLITVPKVSIEESKSRQELIEFEREQIRD